MIVGTTREKVEDSQVKRERWYYPRYGSACRDYAYTYLENTLTKPVIRRKRITAEQNSIPYHPGKCKLTEVLLERIIDTAAKIDFYQPGKYPCHPSWFWGAYAPASLGFPGGSSPAYLSVPVPNYSLDRRLRMEAYSKLNSSGTGLSESLAEGGQVLSMIRSPLDGMSKILKQCIWDAKRANFRTVKDAASAWLELRYGWIPLYSTIQSLLKPLKTSGLLDIAASDTNETSNIGSYEWRFLCPSDAGYVSFLSAISSEVSETHRHRLYYNVVDSRLYEAFHQGSAAFQLPQLLWEWVPLSFVVDWWFNIGDLIAAHTPNPSVSILGETYSIKKVSKTSAHSREVAMPKTTSDPRPRYGTLNAEFCVTREISSYLRLKPEYPYQIPIVPSFNAAFKSVKHAADALGLIIQRVPRRR